MDEKLLKRYQEYASSEEAFAVLLVKKHLTQARGHWVDVVNCRRYEMSSDNMHFRFVVGGLCKRKIRPKYPPQSEYTVNGMQEVKCYGRHDNHMSTPNNSFKPTLLRGLSARFTLR